MWTPVAGQFKYEHTLRGQYQKVTFPNGQTRNFGYDDQGRLLSLSNLDPVAGNLATFAYAYDLNHANGLWNRLGQRVSLTATVPALSFNNHLTKYEYDTAYQLNKTTYPNVAPFNGEVHTWTYDGIGNRLTNKINAVTQTYTYQKIGANPNNWQRLTSDGVNSYTYHLNGEAATRNGPGGNFNFGYRWDGLLATISGAATATYYSDPQGRRYQKVVPGTTTFYLYRGLDLVRETAGATIRDYLFGPGIDEPLAMVQGGVPYYYEVDGLGSVNAIANAGGAVQNAYLYDAWGVQRSQTGSLANPFTYTAREVGEASLWHYRARSYQAGIGRFVQEDPLPFYELLVSSLHPYSDIYRYADNAPTKWIDPLGLKVYLCHAPSQVPGGNWPPFHHWWLKTEHSEAGQQEAPGWPGIPFCPTRIKDETGRSSQPGAKCDEVPSVDELCIDRALATDSSGYGRSLGIWQPGNTCGDVARRILDECRPCPSLRPLPQQRPLPRIPGAGNPDNH